MNTVLNGGMYFSPILFDFPTDDKVYNILEETFMLGYGIKVTPVFEDKISVLEQYFPNYDWFEFGTWRSIMEFNHSAKYGKNITMTCSLESEKINLHVKGGSIFTYQDQAINNNVQRIIKMPEFPVKLIVAPHDRLVASGLVYFDNDTTMSYRQDEYKLYFLHYLHNTLQIIQQGGSKTWKYTQKDETIAEVLILAAREHANTQCVKIMDLDSHSYKIGKHQYESEKEILHITPPDGYTMSFSHIEHITWLNTTC